MFQFFESIAIVDGQARNLIFHQERMERTFKIHYNTKCPFLLTSICNQLNFNLNTSVKYKWKFSYSKSHFKNLVAPYMNDKKNTFHLIHSTIKYPYKFINRSGINRLKNKFSESDEIIIVKDGKITDSSFSNLVFSDGSNWYTPRMPLLSGTMRDNLLLSKNILPEVIHTEDLKSFTTFKCINALNNLEEGWLYETVQISPLKIEKA